MKKNNAAQFPSDLDSYTNDILASDKRDDDEVFKLYNMIHEQYQHYGGIREDHWLNLYNSLDSMKIDTVSVEDCHPGYQSQQRFVEFLEPAFKK